MKQAAVIAPLAPRAPRLAMGAVGAALLAAAMMGYLLAILIPHQVAGDGAAGAPAPLRGNLSDLYPRWLGARELLWHGRDPYSAAITAEIQAGYYGRPLTPADAIKDQQAFAYPLYVAFLLAPLTPFPFSLVQPVFGWALVLLTAWSVYGWLGALGWRVPPLAAAAAALLAAGSWPSLQAWALEQLTALVAALLAAAAYCLTRAMRPTSSPAVSSAQPALLALAGALLALATIKPQLVGLLLVGGALWVAGDGRRRWPLAAGFGGMLAVLLAGAFALQPGWPFAWQAALADYQAYTGGRSLLATFLNAGLQGAGLGGLVGPLSTLIAGAVVVGTLAGWWRARQAIPGTLPFNRILAWTLAATLLIIPTWAPYNQLLLIPGCLLLVQQRAALWATGRRAARWAWVAAAALVGWPNVAALILMGWLAVSLLRGETCCAGTVWSRGWILPLATSLFAPWGVVAALATLWMRPRPEGA